MFNISKTVRVDVCKTVGGTMNYLVVIDGGVVKSEVVLNQKDTRIVTDMQNQVTGIESMTTFEMQYNSDSAAILSLMVMQIAIDRHN